ncbi:YaiI/YqxD family protein [Desulfoscipio sp. XC116]|uniref:YaiI/YqxD family protein n=1 Tax=Desulfoscipio sp. XC116 TaxID=3144975 RepID=UPI00325B3C7F
MKIIVDADACPKNALLICSRLSSDYRIALHTIASFNHNICSDHHTTVGNASQETDLAVMNITARGDIVVTQDGGLAAMVLGKGAAALSPGGKIFRKETIVFLLEERATKARLRRSGGHTRGPRKRTPEDDKQFAASLRRLIEERNETDG